MNIVWKMQLKVIKINDEQICNMFSKIFFFYLAIQEINFNLPRSNCTKSILWYLKEFNLVNVQLKSLIYYWLQYVCRKFIKKFLNFTFRYWSKKKCIGFNSIGMFIPIIWEKDLL